MNAVGTEPSLRFWRGKRVLVTGCSGLIGGHLCKKLLEAGAQIRGLDLDTVGTLRWHGIEDKFPVVKADILSSPMEPYLRHGQDGVFHLAAVSNVEVSRRLAGGALAVSIVGTLRLLDAARLADFKGPVVVASSNHIYGDQGGELTVEDAPFRQLDTYSVGKTCTDYLARCYAHNYGLNTVVIRNTNCFGDCDPHQDHIVPATILSILKGKPPIIKSDGRRKKSYLYVGDVADAYMLACEFAANYPEQRGQAFNIAGVCISVQWLVELICRQTNWHGGVKVLNEPNDQHDEALSWGKAHQQLGWDPRMTLDEALDKTIGWFKEHRTEFGVVNDVSAA